MRGRLIETNEEGSIYLNDGEYIFYEHEEHYIEPIPAEYDDEPEDEGYETGEDLEDEGY